MDDLYREQILDHYKNPRQKGQINPSDHSFEDENPLCGDFLHIDLKTDDQGVITDAKFEGQGCAISMASADLLLESMIGKTIEDDEKIIQTGCSGSAWDRIEPGKIEVRLAFTQSDQSSGL